MSIASDGSAASRKKLAPNAGSSRPVAASTNFWNSLGFGGGNAKRRALSLPFSVLLLLLRPVPGWLFCSPRVSGPALVPLPLVPLPGWPLAELPDREAPPDGVLNVLVYGL